MIDVVRFKNSNKEKIEEAKALKANGLSHRQIAVVLCLSRATIERMLGDPIVILERGQKQKKRKRDRGIVSHAYGPKIAPDQYLVERARSVAAEVQVAIENGQFDAARAAIDAAERIGGSLSGDITALAESSSVVELLSTGGQRQDFANKLCNEFERHGITTIGQLLNTSRERLFACNNIGPASVKTVIDIAEKWVAGQRSKFARMNGASESESPPTPG